jgi:protein gp37
MNVYAKRYNWKLLYFDGFAVMTNTPQDTYQVLNKKANRLFELHEHLDWTENIGMSVSVEDASVIERIDFLRQTNAKTKFLY